MQFSVRRDHRRALSLSALALLLSACGSDNGNRSPAATLRGTVAVGAAVGGATVSATCVTGNYSTTSNAASGNYGLVIPGANFPCAVSATGGALGGTTLHSFANAPGTANITPLTDLALALQVNNTTGQTLAAWFSNPGNLGTLNATLADAVDDLRDALIAAGYSVPTAWTAGSTTPFTGTFTPDPASDPFDQLLEALADAIANSGSYADYDALLAAFASGGALPDTGGGSAATTVPATLHASLANTYNLTFHVGGGAGCGSVCDYVDNQAISATVHADGRLSIGGKTLLSPYYRKIGDTTFTTEIIWKDGDIEYALSDNSTGVFNEINVGNAANMTGGFPQFLGQMNASGGAGNALITQFAGTYGITRQYKGGTLAWTSVTIGNDGSITFNADGAPSITSASVSAVTDRLSCCGRVDIALNYDLDGSGSVTGTDRINLYADAGGELAAIEYPTGTSSNNDVAVRVNVVPALVHDGASVPASESLKATAVISGGASTALDVAMDPSSYGSPVFHQFSLVGTIVANSVLQQQISLQVDATAPLAQGQTLGCYEYQGGSDTIRLSVKTAPVSGSDYSSQYGGNCSITLTAVETDAGGQNFTLIEGTFTAELYPFKRNNAPVTIRNGVFRWVP